MTTRKRILLSLVGVAVAILLVWQFHHSPEWQRFSWQAVWTATANAEGGYIVGSVLLIYASYLIRSWRWQILMTPAGRFWPVLKGTTIGFTSTALLGRAGELVRPYYIGRKHQGGLSPQLAVWVLERTLDMAGVVFLVGLNLAFNPEINALTRNSNYQSAFRRAGEVITIAILVLLGLIYLFHLRSRHILEKLRRRQQQRPSAFIKRLEGFLTVLAQGTVSLTRARTLIAAILYTLLLWVDISGSIWMAVRAYPAMLPGFSFSGGILLMGLTAVGSVVQLPAVGGGFQVLTIFGLTQIFGAETAAATSAALIIWLVCFYAIAPFGTALAMHEGISWRGLEHEAFAAEENEASGAQPPSPPAQIKRSGPASPTPAATAGQQKRPG